MMILNLIAAVLSRPLFLALILAGAGLTLAHFSRRRAGASTPAGLDKYKTGSPVPRNCTP